MVRIKFMLIHFAYDFFETFYGAARRIASSNDERIVTFGYGKL